MGPPNTRTCPWAVPAPALQSVDSGSMFAENPRSSPPPPPYLTILNRCFQPGTLTPLEEEAKRRTAVALRELSQQIEGTRSRRERLLEVTGQLLEEKSRAQAEHQFLVDYLSRENEQYRKKHEELRRQIVHECEALEQRRQESASRYTQRNAALGARLLQGRMTQAELRQQLQALKPVSVIKERQAVKLQTLEEEKEKIPGETAARDREAHFRFLQEKACMEKQLEALGAMELGDTSTKELRRKAEALSLAAKRAHVDFCLGLTRESQQLQTELEQLRQEYCELEAARSHLAKQQQRLEEEQGYLEALVRGRQRLQAEREQRRGRDRKSGSQRTAHAKDPPELSPRHQNQE